MVGEYGAAAIRRGLLARPGPGGPAAVPAERTIARVLARHGAVAFDVIEDLKLAGGPLLDVLTGVSLRGGLPAAWPLARATTAAILPCLQAHWAAVGRPHYAQFDDDTRFQGPRQHPDDFGRVTRYCLQLGVTPVFVAPHEFGLQNAVEHFKGLYTAKVLRRFHYASRRALAGQSARYVAARRLRLAARIAAAPARAAWRAGWAVEPRVLPAGTVVFIRRASAAGRVTLRGREWPVDPHWCHRLVRAEVALRAGEIRCTALRRREPAAQPLLATLPYRYPRPDLRR